MTGSIPYAISERDNPFLDKSAVKRPADIKFFSFQQSLFSQYECFRFADIQKRHARRFDCGSENLPIQIGNIKKNKNQNKNKKTQKQPKQTQQNKKPNRFH